MSYAFVLLLAVAVGAGVYISTIRGDGQVAQGPSSTGDPAERGTYVPVAPEHPDWQSRLTGFLGLVVAVVVGAVLLAFTLYTGIERLIRFATDAVGD